MKRKIFVTYKLSVDGGNELTCSIIIQVEVMDEATLKRITGEMEIKYKNAGQSFKYTVVITNWIWLEEETAILENMSRKMSLLEHENEKLREELVDVKITLTKLDEYPNVVVINGRKIGYSYLPGNNLSYYAIIAFARKEHNLGYSVTWESDDKGNGVIDYRGGITNYERHKNLTINVQHPDET